MSTDPDHDQLRALLQDAVADVHPQHGPDAVQARIKRPSRGRWLPLTAAVAATVAALTGGTAYVAHRADQSSVSGPATPQNTEDPSLGRDLNVPVYYVGKTAAGPRLFTEYHEVRHTTVTPLQAAVDQALNAKPLDPDYRNSFPAGGVTAYTSENGQAITIDLTKPLARPAGMSTETATMALQSLVWTADQAASSALPVRFTVKGKGVSSVLGVSTTSLVPVQSADQVLSTVSIDSPPQGAHLRTTFEVRGQAATFEANVVWELTRAGHVVRHGYTTATQCCTLSPYSFTVSVPPGDYTLTVHDTNESTGEGVGTSQDTKDITVSQGSF